MGKLIINTSILVSSIVAFIICISTPILNEAYKIVWILPLTFIVIFTMILSNLILNTRSLTVMFFTIFSYIRFIIIPLLSVLSGEYSSMSMYVPTFASIVLSIKLMSYELTLSSIFLFIFVRKVGGVPRYNSEINKLKVVKGNKLAYILFIIFSFLVYLIYGHQNNIFSFLFLRTTDTGIRVGDINETRLVIIRQIVTAGIIFFYVLSIDYLRNKNEKHNKKIYLNLALVVSLINISIITGERRSLQIYTGFVSIYLLLLCFNKNFKKIVFVLGSGASLVLVLMSIYKFFNTFLYGNYLDSIKNSQFNLKNISLLFSAYFGGIDLTAAAIDMKTTNLHELYNMFYDFLRSTFGISFLLKDKMPLTSEIFNTQVYGFSRKSGQLITSLGYGYYYFGLFFAPFFTIINTYLTLKLEKLLMKTSSLEMAYMWTFIFVRFSTNIFQSTPPLVSMASIYLFSLGLVYVFGISLKNKNSELRLS